MNLHSSDLGRPASRLVSVMARALGRASVALMVSLACATSVAQGADAPRDSAASASQAQYVLDRERCNDVSQYEDKQACLREAAAAHAARLRAAGDNPGTSNEAAWQANRERRCDPLPTEEREDCLRRVRGEGFAAGSVGGGGIYRETKRRELGGQPSVKPVEIK